MKRIILLSLTSLTMFSCSQMDANQEVKPTPKTTVETSVGELTKDNPNTYLRYEEYSVEGCQYIVVGIGANKWGSHKGNCSNTIHKK
jgi:hypothetical protein